MGFEKDDGRLIEGGNYDQVCAVLNMVQKGELSKRKAARELDISRATISLVSKESVSTDGILASVFVHGRFDGVPSHTTPQLACQM